MERIVDDIDPRFRFERNYQEGMVSIVLSDRLTAVLVLSSYLIHTPVKPSKINGVLDEAAKSCCPCS